MAQGFLLLWPALISGAVESTDENPPVVTVEAPANAPEAAALDEEHALRAIVTRLSGTRWALELQPMFGAKSEAPLKDTLSFNGNDMTSELFAATGFPSSTFTVTLGADGVAAWEANQLNPEEGIVLWHGEVHDHTINGTISKCPVQGTTEDFVFVGQEAVQPPAPAAPADDSSSPAPEQKD